MAHGPELPLSFACLQVDDVGKRKGQAGRSLPVPRGESIGSRCRWGTSQILTTSESPEMFYRDLTFTVPWPQKIKFASDKAELSRLAAFEVIRGHFCAP